MSHPEMWARLGDSLPVVKYSRMDDLLLLGCDHRLTHPLSVIVFFARSIRAHCENQSCRDSHEGIGVLDDSQQEPKPRVKFEP